MLRDENQGSTWASIVAVLSLIGTLSLLYAPLVLR
jgi:hypothetical protein